MPELLAVCVVHQLHDDAGTIGTTAIDKRPVAGRVKVGPYGVYADVQADRKHHGGLEQALYVYAEEDAAYWQAELGRDLPPGAFGENLRTSGIDVNAARIGEVWRIGETVEVEVTKPRRPCATFARWMGPDLERGWVKRFADSGRLGPYLRVLRNGTIGAGDAITVVSVSAGAPTVVDAFRRP